jgi:hypothetical protein
METRQDDGRELPTTPTSQVPEPAPAENRGCGGRCCLWGCGGLTAIVVLAIASLAILYVTFGRPWLDEKKTEILTRFPALGFALETPSLRTSLELVRDGSTARQEFPPDIYIPEDSISAAYRTSAASAVARLRLPATTELESVAASYRREMARLGWTREPVRDPRNGIRLRFVRPDAAVRVLLRQDRDSVSVWIHRRSPE